MALLVSPSPVPEGSSMSDHPPPDEWPLWLAGPSAHLSSVCRILDSLGKEFFGLRGVSGTPTKLNLS